MRLHTIFSAMAIIPALFAQANKNPFFPQGNILPDGKDPATYLAPAGTQVKTSWDLHVDGSFIYWYTGQDAMDLAYSAPKELGGAPGNVIYPNFGYKPGFKLGLGFDTNYDDWSFDANWTWLHQSENSLASSGAGFSAANWFVNPVEGLFGYVGSIWGMHLDIVDVCVGRPYYEGKRIVVSPSGGFRVMTLHQGLSIQMGSSFVGDAPAVFYGHSHSWAVGPKAGINAKWFVWKGLNVDGLFGASVLYTRFVSLNATQAQTSQVTSSSADVGAIKPVLDMGVGLGYGAYAFKDKFYFDIAARYDFSQYWSQNVLRNYVSQLSGGSGAIGDLYTHGLTLDLRVAF